MPIILRLVGKGPKILFTRRSSDAADAVARRERFQAAARAGAFDSVEIDFAGFFVEEAIVAPAGSPAKTQWQPAVILSLLRIAEPDIAVPGEGEAADHAEDEARAARVAELRAAPDAPQY
jgi:hypothetical protein